MNIQWNVVTWYSKALAVLLFLLVIPAVAAFLGARYGESKALSELTLIPDPATIVSHPAASPVIATSSPDTAGSADCADAETTLAITNCRYESYMIQQRALDREYDEYLATLRETNDGIAKTVADRFSEAQTAWTAYRDSQCELESSVYEGGTIQPSVELACKERLTRERVEELSLTILDVFGPCFGIPEGQCRE